MIQRAIEKGVSRFFIPAIDSSCTAAMYDLEKNYPEHVFLMMGPSYLCKGELFRIAACGRRISEKEILCRWEIEFDL
jgi:TatD DNase family protein